jgi:hypothetical protein
MSKNIFISYSRRDQEFVTRLASDLDAQVTGVWFDQSAIQLGENWHEEIMDGIRECKAFILVLSPDAAESKYVREEVNKALELGKTIYPVIYRAAKWTGEFESLVKEIQTLDLRSGSYTDSFHKLVDGLIEAGAGKATGERPFLRQPAKTPINIVLSKVPGWAFAWGLGWLIFWIVGLTLLAILIRVQGDMKSEYLIESLLILIGAGVGGFTGGLIAGLITMLALRPNAPSISWKHMVPSIRIWAISGPLGMVVSLLITFLMITVGAISIRSADCEGLGLGECIGAIVGEVAVFFLLAISFFLLLAVVTWFLTGMFAGSQSVRHIRKLEPGITNKQGRSVSLGWGCGAIVAVIVMIFIFGILASALGL